MRYCLGWRSCACWKSLLGSDTKYRRLIVPHMLTPSPLLLYNRSLRLSCQTARKQDRCWTSASWIVFVFFCRVAFLKWRFCLWWDRGRVGVRDSLSQVSWIFPFSAWRRKRLQVSDWNSTKQSKALWGWYRVKCVVFMEGFIFHKSSKEYMLELTIEIGVQWKCKFFGNICIMSRSTVWKSRFIVLSLDFE